ncbi:MAG: hypothetical protein IKP66_05920 [Lachnospiraceae bacterium]|nr:hypothetical protein [Lachnospiraceae bacterium]
MYRLQLSNLIDLVDTKRLVEEGKPNLKNRPYFITLEEILISDLTGINSHFMNLLQGNLFTSKKSFECYSTFDKELSQVLEEYFIVLDFHKIMVLGPTYETQCHSILLHGGVEMDSILESLTHKVVLETNIGIALDFVMLYVPHIGNNKEEYATKFDGKNSKYTFFELPNDNTMGVVIAYTK